MAKNGIRFQDYLKTQMKDPEFRKHYEAYETSTRLAIEIAKMRHAKKMTQSQLAKKLRVRQQMVAQLENPGETLPNVRTLQRVAQAFGKELYIGFR